MAGDSEDPTMKTNPAFLDRLQALNQQEDALEQTEIAYLKEQRKRSEAKRKFVETLLGVEEEE